MERTRHQPGTTPGDNGDVEKKRDQRERQPYATEIDNRELETAQKEKRPISPEPPDER